MAALGDPAQGLEAGEMRKHSPQKLLEISCQYAHQSKGIKRRGQTDTLWAAKGEHLPGNG